MEFNWLLYFFVFAFFIKKIFSANESDLVTTLPGITFDVKFKHYSGYLNAGNNGTWKMFYWLVEAQNNPETAPILFWFNGGPGCSSVGGLVEELGPFYINKDSSTLYENIYSWNKYANVIALESPIGVGFSYDTQNITGYTTGDDLAAQQNHDAINDFFKNVQPKFINRTWFISGESYAGVYIPTMTRNILQSISINAFSNPNFQGIAIGNGYMHVNLLTSSLVLWDYYHGVIGYRKWQQLKQACCTDMDTCDFSQYLLSNLTNVYAYPNNGTNINLCGQELIDYFTLTGIGPSNGGPIDAYNWYQDCYKQDYLSTTIKLIKKHLKIENLASQTADILNYDSTDNQNSYTCWNGLALRNYLNKTDVLSALHIDKTWIDTDTLNYDSTDNQNNYPCYNGIAVYGFFNKTDVTDALHIDKAWVNSSQKWADCRDNIYNNWNMTYVDTTNVFYNITDVLAQIPNIKNFRILVYNGDVDTVCNFIGDAILMDQIAANRSFNTNLTRVPWWFRNQIGGFHQPYTKPLANDNTLYLDVVTVKGSGHFVPNDRPGPSMQMITNFIRGTGNYSNTDGIDVVPVPNDIPNNNASSFPTSTSSSSTTSTTTSSPTTSSGLKIVKNLFLIVMGLFFVIPHILY